MCITRISLGLIMIAGVRSTSSRSEIFGGLVISLKLTEMSLSIARGGLMYNMPRLGVSLVSEARMFRGDENIPFVCHPSPSLTTFAFRSQEVRRLLLILGSRGGTDPSGMLSLF